MSTFTQSMFDSIKSALANSNTSGSNNRVDILKFTPDNQYDVRFVPNVKSPEKTFHHYYTGLISGSTGSGKSELVQQIAMVRIIINMWCVHCCCVDVR